MATKKITTFIISILALAISALFAGHYLRPPVRHLPGHYPVDAIQASLQKPQVASYNTQATLDIPFTNESIAKLVVGTLITFAVIGGLITIYRKRFESSAAIVPNTETISAHNSTLYNTSAPFSLRNISPHHESEHTTGNSDDNGQSAHSYHDTGYRSESPMPPSPKGTIGGDVSFPLLPKNTYPYPLHTQGNREEHYWHQPVPSIKGYGNKSYQSNPEERVTFSWSKYRKKRAKEARKKQKAQNMKKNFLSQNQSTEDIKQVAHLAAILESMLKGKALANDTVTYRDISMYEKLSTKGGDVSDEAKKRWDQFRQQQQNITIDMRHMYLYYEKLRDKLCVSQPKSTDHPAHKNLLLFDKIVEIFPNITQITCTQTDYIGLTRQAYGGYNPEVYSPNIVNLPFIEALFARLDQLPNKHKLKKIIIKTFHYTIKETYPSSATKLGGTGWAIRQENKTITITRNS